MLTKELYAEPHQLHSRVLLGLDPLATLASKVSQLLAVHTALEMYQNFNNSEGVQFPEVCKETTRYLFSRPVYRNKKNIETQTTQTPGVRPPPASSIEASISQDSVRLMGTLPSICLTGY